MRKLCLAGFWIGQYIFGIAAIVAIQMNIPLLPYALLVASYFSTVVAGKLLGIGPELQKEANEQVPVPSPKAKSLTDSFRFPREYRGGFESAI
jgi:hypothetical protein